MHNRTLLRILALATALLCLMTTSAFAATCVQCGGETGSDDYLCTGCLLALLHQERESVPLEIVSAEQNTDGTVTVAWTDDAANGPYTVYYEPLEAAPIPFGWTEATDVTENSFTLIHLVPGVSYVITVQNALGQTAKITYFAPTPGADTAIGAKIRITPMRRTAPRTTKRQTVYSANDINADNGVQYGLYLQLSYSTLRATRHYTFQIAIEAPNGFSDVILCGTLELHHGRSSVPAWGFVPLDDYFRLLKTYYGGVPTGEYDVTLYFNGQKVHSQPLTVVE